MTYKYSELLDAHTEDGIVFISLKHKKTELVCISFLASHVFEKPIFLNWGEMEKKLKEIEDESKKNNKPIILDTILLEIQQDLIKIYNEFI